MLVLSLLTACSDESGTSEAGKPGKSSVSSGEGTPARNVIPTALPPTPTYTPLPVTPTIAPTPTPPVILGGQATGAALNDALTLHPYKANNSTGQQYLPLLYGAGLTRLDPLTLQPQPAAAEHWSVTDTTVTFTLKADLKWSDGQPLTSADYLWTYQQAAKPQNGWPLAQEAIFNPDDPASAGIETYQAPDPQTLVIKLHSFSADIISRADIIEPLPSHIWGNLDWNDPTRNPQIKAPSVVSGPWKLKEWQPNTLITFERNPNSSVYPVPRLESLTFKIVPDSQVALQKLKTAEIDFFSPSPAEFSNFARLPDVQAYTWGPARPTWYFAGFNFQKPDLQDKTLRQALAWATDYRAILQNQAFGLGRRLNSSLPPWHPAFNPDTARYTLDLAKARELLKQAGYTLQNNKLVNQAGKPIGPLKLVYNSPSPLYEGLANTLKTNFAALGIGLELRNFDYENYRKFLAGPTADFDLFLSGWRAGYAPENFVDVWRGGRDLNSGSYQNSRLLDVYVKAQNEPDAARRQEWLDLAQGIEAEDLPYIFLYAEQGRLVANKRLAGFAAGLLGPEQNRYSDWFASK
jgi:peptide/nickel transport system substrate-binding protein